MESTKDGSEVISFQLKSKATVRIRCSMYQREDDVYFVPEDVLLSDWKSQSSIIGTVNMQPTPGKRGSFTLHPSCNESLQKLGISPFNADDCNSPTEDEQVDPSTSLIDDEFYEVDDVVDRRLSKDAHCYEYKVRFKGYGPQDDMWLPASFFNRSIHFGSTSKFGRKRKHTVDPDNVIEGGKRAKRCTSKNSRSNASRSDKREMRSSKKQSKRQTSAKRNGKLNNQDHSKDHMAPSASKTSVMDAKAHQVLSGSEEEISKDSGKGKRRHTVRGKMGQGVSLSERPKESPSSQRNVPKSNRRKCSKKENKGRFFRSSSLVQMTDSGSPEIIDTNTGFVGSEQDKAISVDVVIDERNTSVSGILVDVVRNNENFFHPRRFLSQASYPPVDGALTVFEIVTESGDNLTDPTQVFVLPPQSVLSEIEEKLNKSKTTPLFFKFPGYGIFDRDGIRVLGRFHLVKSLKRQVQFEEKWLKQKNMSKRLLQQCWIDGTKMAVS